MKNIKKILLLLILWSLIPLQSYSSSIIQDSLSINKKQIKSVLKDKARLNFLEKQQIENDSIEADQENKIKDLKLIILSNATIKQNQVIEIDYWKTSYYSEKRKNKLILISSGIIIGGVTYLYITK